MERDHADGSSYPAAFPKWRRLLKRREFLIVQRRGRKIHLRDLLALIRPRAGQTRLGITVSRKVGNAPQRNRVKRVVRESWRRLLHTIPEGYDIVIIAKRSAVSLPFHAAQRQLAELGRRLEGSHAPSGR